MITNKQYQRLMSEYGKTGEFVVSAMKADVHPQTARKYLEAVLPPAELQAKHTWRTRPDPVAAIWERAQQMLTTAPELEAKELFEYLCRMDGEQAGVEPGALRTFQRRVLAWQKSACRTLPSDGGCRATQSARRERNGAQQVT